jgi:hypothetical protein
MLEEPSHGSDAAVHRRRRRPRPAKHHHLVSARHLTGLPVQVVEEVGRSDLAQPERPIVEEPGEVRQIERVGPHCRRREPPQRQMLEEAVARLDHPPVTDEAVTLG